MEKIHIDWQAKYELGVEDIDFQHHFFLNLINRLAVELNQSNDKQYSGSLIAELNAYARFHFISEENMMYAAQYPALAEHKQHHRNLIDQLSSKGNRILMDSSETNINEILNFLIHWFIHHTTTEDKLFAQFLERQNDL